jgi:hypothetical protein
MPRGIVGAYAGRGKQEKQSRVVQEKTTVAI